MAAGDAAVILAVLFADDLGTSRCMGQLAEPVASPSVPGSRVLLESLRSGPHRLEATDQ
jgi:hypothetical protein